MAKHYEEKKKNKGCFSKLSILALCFVISAVVLYFVTSWIGEAEVYFMKSIYPQKYTEYVEQSCEKYQLDEALVYGVIKTESDFKPDSVSSAGAKGLMQMMPESFQWVQKLKGESLDEEKLFDPETNIDYGCYLLKYFLNTYKNEECAVAAYNAGFVVSSWLEDERYSIDGKTLYSIPYSETEHYVEKVENAKKRYTELYYKEK